MYQAIYKCRLCGEVFYHDEVLGVYLASDNQYAERIS